MRKISLVILTTILLLTIAETQLSNQANANPYRYVPHVTNVPPPAGTQAPIISIHTPQNGSSYPRNVIPLTFDVIIPHTNGEKSIGRISELYYEASWESKEIQIIDRPFYENSSFSIDLYISSGGNLSFTVYAVVSGSYETKTELTDFERHQYFDQFEMNSSSTVTFTQDFLPPKITVLSPQNTSYEASEVELDLTANEALSQIQYSLDGNKNQTTTGKMTLTGVTNGAHNITVYASDLAGNEAFPETISFSVKKQEPFPTAPVAAILIVVTAICIVLALGIMKTRRKRSK
jgi:hypothetical protein